MQPLITMKTPTDWINQKWLWISTALVVTILIHIGLRYYFWSLSAENYDNIVTPTATVLSVILFVWLTWRQSKIMESQNSMMESQTKMMEGQNKMMEVQNRIMESQNIKPHFTGKIERLKVALENSHALVTNPVFNEVNDLNFIDKIREVYNELKKEPIFSLWINQHIQGNQHQRKEFDQRVLRELDFLSQFFVVPIQTYYRVEDLIREINKSVELTDTDRKQLKSIIKETLVIDFMKFVEFNLDDQTLFMVPIVYGVNNPDEIVHFDQIQKSRDFLRFYNFFKTELGQAF
jgi:hypothetical protein